MSRDPRMLSRRETLRLLSGGIGGSLLLPHLVHGATAPSITGAPRIERIGVQLYTVRAALAKDVEGTVAAIAKAGITELEFFNMFGKPVAFWTSLMARHGLTAPASHEGLPATDDGWAPIFDRAHGMGHRWVIVPWVGDDYRGSRAAWQRLAARLTTGAERAKAAGLGFGYHNHDFEFTPVDGTTGFEILTTETDPGLMKLELDLYWAVKAGQDPMAILRRWPGRVISCHVKDAGPAPEREMREVGQGTIDFRSLLSAGKASGLAHWFIEHDNPVDPVASVTASAAAMRRF